MFKLHRKKLILLLVFINIAALSALFVVINTSETVATKKHGREMKEKPVVVDTFAPIMVTEREIPLYIKSDTSFKKAGTVLANVTLVLNKAEPYYQLKDSEYYVAPEYLHAQEALHVDQSYKRYLVFNENAVSHKKVTLYNEIDQAVVSVNSLNQPIYKKVENRTYILFNEQLVYLKNEEVQEFVQTNNSDVKEATRIPVFMYHFFFDSQANEHGADGNFIDIHTFTQHIQNATAAGFQSLKMKDLDLFLDGSIRLPAKSYMITIDDNAESVKRLAYPVLEANQTHATSFVISSWVQDITPILSDYVELQSHTNDMHKGGCREQHGSLMLCIPHDQGVQDLVTSSQKLQGAFALAYPIGDFNDAAISILKDAGYHLAFTTQHGYVSKDQNKLTLPRLRITINTNADIFMDYLNKANP